MAAGGAAEAALLLTVADDVALPALAAERTVPMITEHVRGFHGWGSEIAFTRFSSDPEALFSCSSLPYGLVGCYRITQRNKKRFEAQPMLVQLGALAHNVLVWAREWLAPLVPMVSRLGIKRLVRDVFGMSGGVETDGSGHPVRLILNHANRWARRFAPAFQALVGREHLIVALGDT
jgi:hypothetical protein